MTVARALRLIGLAAAGAMGAFVSLLGGTKRRRPGSSQRAVKKPPIVEDLIP